MTQIPNILVQLGEVLGPGGSIVVLLLLCGGAVWVVMAIRSNQADHARVEAMIERLRKESREDAKEIRAEIRAINSRLDQLIGRMPPDQPS